MAISGFHCCTLAFLFLQIALVGTGHAAGDDELGPGITGRVVLQLDGEPVRDAQVVFTGGAGISFETTSDRSGFFSLFLNESDTAIEADRSIPVSEAVAHFMGQSHAAGPPDRRAFAAGAFSVLVAMGVLGISDGSMINGRLGVLFAVLFAAVARDATDPSPATGQRIASS